MAPCNNCGHDNKKNVKFCSSCGTKIEISAPMVEKESTSKILEDERKKATPTQVPKYGEEISKKSNKMRKGVAIGGALLMALGLVMVVIGGIAGTCWISNTCPSGSSLGVMISWAVFWIGLIPTIFGVRFVAKA